MNLLDFRAFGPPTIETFARNWRTRCYRDMRRALQAIRERNRWGASSHIGHADAAVSVLFDVNHPLAYRAYQRLVLIRRIASERLARNK